MCINMRNCSQVEREFLDRISDRDVLIPYIWSLSRGLVQTSSIVLRFLKKQNNKKT